MTRTVISFERLGRDTVFKLEDAPIDINGIGDNEIADISPPPGDTLSERGRALLERLVKHPPVKHGLAAALAIPPGGAPVPLYFHMLAAGADQLPWELIYDPQHGFFALDKRWPVGRIAARRRRVEGRAFTPPLRLVAVLSAAGRDGLPQLEALLAAVSSDDAAAIGTHLHVISAQEDLLDAASNAPNVSCEVIAGTAPGLEQQIAVAKPHILHLLCHGGATAGLRTLAFATLADQDVAASGAGGEEPTGSLRLTVPSLLGALRSSDPWLLVLSACDTAEAADGPALAHDLAAAGLPAVVGMRRLVDLGDTNLFCKALYPEVLAAVRTAVDPNGPPTGRRIDWAASLTAPKVSMTGEDSSIVDSWTDPVLYVQDDWLEVFPGSPALSPTDYTRLKGQLDTWERYLATLDPATTNPAVIAEVLDKIASLRVQLAQADP
jgi:CHAT domain